MLIRKIQGVWQKSFKVEENFEKYNFMIILEKYWAFVNPCFCKGCSFGVVYGTKISNSKEWEGKTCIIHVK